MTPVPQAAVDAVHAELGCEPFENVKDGEHYCRKHRHLWLDYGGGQCQDARIIAAAVVAAVQGPIRAEASERVQRLIRATDVSRAELELRMPTCGRRNCGHLAGHYTADDTWAFMIERVANEVGWRMTLDDADRIEAQ